MRTLAILLLLVFGRMARSATGPPGECTKGQGDDTTHPASAYYPVVYSFTPSSQKATSSAPQMQVMSWNIQSDYSLYCNLSLSSQLALMQSINPDFLGLQETDIDVDIRCNCNMPQKVANALGHETYFMQMFPFRTGKYGDIASFGYPTNQTVYVYYNVSSSFEQRGALANLVSPPQLHGQKMWYINTHLEQSSLDIRIKQVNQLINWVNNTLLFMQPNAVVVMTGDFYTVPGDTSYEPMAAYFTNAWATFHGSTDGGFTHPSDAPTERFDHIWWRDPAAHNIKTSISNFTIVRTLLSDHLPIVATLEFATTGSVPTTSAPSTSAPSTSAPSTSAPSTSAPSNTCSDAQRGNYRCVTNQGFQQCDHGMWTRTINCPPGTVCVPYGNVIYCGYAMTQ